MNKENQPMTTDSLFTMPKNVQTRWASPENWDGAKGAAGQANNGRKGSPCFALKAGEQKVLAHAENTSGTVRRIWMTINDRSVRCVPEGRELPYQFTDGRAQLTLPVLNGYQIIEVQE